MHVYQDSSRFPCSYQHLSAAPTLYTQGSRHILALHILLLIRAQYAVQIIFIGLSLLFDHCINKSSSARRLERARLLYVGWHRYCHLRIFLRVYTLYTASSVALWWLAGALLCTYMFVGAEGRVEDGYMTVRRMRRSIVLDL